MAARRALDMPRHDIATTQDPGPGVEQARAAIAERERASQSLGDRHTPVVKPGYKDRAKAYAVKVGRGALSGAKAGGAKGAVIGATAGAPGLAKGMAAGAAKGGASGVVIGGLVGGYSAATGDKSLDVDQMVSAGAGYVVHSGSQPKSAEQSEPKTARQRAEEQMDMAVSARGFDQDAGETGYER